MATLRSRGKAYLLTWSDAAGQHRRVIGKIGVLSKREAEAKLRELEYQLAVSRAGPVRPVVPTFAAFAEEYLAWHALEFPASTPRIRQLFTTHLVPRFGLLPLDQLTPRDVEQYKHDRSRAGASVGTITKELRSLKAAYSKAVEWKILQSNPILYVRAPKQLKSRPPHFYTAQELEKLYAASPFHGPLWKLIANLGLRRTEAQNLKWEHISSSHVLIPSSEEARTKSGEYRKVPLSPGALEALRWVKSKYRMPDYVLPRMTAPSLSRAFRKCAQRAGLSGSLHSLRHTFGSHLAMQGKNARTIKELMGHSTIRVSEQYMHLSPSHLQSAVQELTL